MFSMTDPAKQELEAYFADKDKTPIRIYLAGGCGGPRLALALDEPGEDDTVVEDSGFSFCINKELLSLVGSVAVDMTPMGFSVEPEFPLPNAGGGCGGGCCSSGCSSGGGCC